MRLRSGFAALLLTVTPIAALQAQRSPGRVTAQALGAVCGESQPACLTYVMGTLDAATNLAVRSGMRLAFCIPDNVRNDQVAQTALRYVRAHSELAGENAAAVVLAGLREAYPCR